MSSSEEETENVADIRWKVRQSRQQTRNGRMLTPTTEVAGILEVRLMALRRAQDITLYGGVEIHYILPK